MPTLQWKRKERGNSLILTGKIVLWFRIAVAPILASCVLVLVLAVIQNHSDAIPIVFGLSFFIFLALAVILYAEKAIIDPSSLKYQTSCFLNFPAKRFEKDEIEGILYRYKTKARRGLREYWEVFVQTADEKYKLHSAANQSSWMIVVAIASRLNVTIIDETTRPDRQITPQQFSSSIWETIEPLGEPIHLPHYVSVEEQVDQTTFIIPHSTNWAAVAILAFISFPTFLFLAVFVQLLESINKVTLDAIISVIIIGGIALALLTGGLACFYAINVKTLLILEKDQLLIGYRNWRLNLIRKRIKYSDFLVLELTDPFPYSDRVMEATKLTIKTKKEAVDFGPMILEAEARQILTSLQQEILTYLLKS